MLTSKTLQLGKVSGELITKSYNFEYRKIYYLYKKSVEKFNSYVIGDDLLAKFVNGICKILRNMSKRVIIRLMQ